MRESGTSLEHVEWPQTGLHTHLLLVLLLPSPSLQPQGNPGPSTQKGRAGCNPRVSSVDTPCFLEELERQESRSNSIGFAVSRGQHLDSICPTICCFRPRGDCKACQPTPELCRRVLRSWGRPASTLPYTPSPSIPHPSSFNKPLSLESVNTGLLVF